MSSVVKITNTLLDVELDERKLQIFNDRTLKRIKQLKNFSEVRIFEIQVVASVFPFRVNNYVLTELIDWSNVPEDPIFRLTFPNKRMLADDDYKRIAALHRNGSSRDEINALAAEIRDNLNPHPAGQLNLNRPNEDPILADGLQHKYPETILLFPKQGQTCHAYCTFCFRWAQFIGDSSLKMATDRVDDLLSYLRRHPEVTDVLITGGDPLVMKTEILKQYLLPLASAEFEHIQTIRIGTKALSYWPYRFLSDNDADDLLALFNAIVDKGKHLAFMAHFNHWRELDTSVAETAIRKVLNTGAKIRSQGPLLAHINDDSRIWEELWRRQVKLGIIPYYMFVERDTGARRYFEVPLVKAWHIYRDAIKNVSGLARTARGPSMSTGPGKVEVQGVAEVHGEKVFVLRFIQGRNPEWVQRPFFAKFDPYATWLDELKPAFNESKFFYQEEYEQICRHKRSLH